MKKTPRILTVLFLSVLAGCQSPEETRKQYPTYPQWGWWDKPAAKQAPLEAEGIETDTVPTAAETTSRPPRTLEEHRARVWAQVSVLRDLDDLPRERQKRLLEQTRRNLRDWYAPMSVPAPSPDQADWITVLIWDFMPDEEFDRAAETWRRIAQQENQTFPDEITRRGLMEFIQTMTGGAGAKNTETKDSNHE